VALVVLRLLAGLVHYVRSRTVVALPGRRLTQKITPLAHREVYLMEGRSDPSLPVSPRNTSPSARELLPHHLGPLDDQLRRLILL
jgi:hypothetical protein